MPLSFLFACSAGCSFPACRGGSFLACSRGSFLACFPMALRCSAPACSVFPMVHPFRQIACLAGACCRTRFPLSSTAPPAGNSATVPLPAALPDGSLPQCRNPLRYGTPGQQHLPDGSSLQRPCRQHLCHCGAPCQQLRHGAPASNKPHLAEKSTPVWLAIWYIWAGFANSQHGDAALATPDNICAHSSLLPHWAAAQTDANLSAHLHRLPTPPPYLRRMRLSHGRGRRYRVLDEAVASQGRRRRMANAAAGCSWRSSCKSPRARILVLGTSGAHWPARWPRFVLTERFAKS